MVYAIEFLDPSLYIAARRWRAVFPFSSRVWPIYRQLFFGVNLLSLSATHSRFPTFGRRISPG